MLAEDNPSPNFEFIKALILIWPPQSNKSATVIKNVKILFFEPREWERASYAVTGRRTTSLFERSPVIFITLPPAIRVTSVVDPDEPRPPLALIVSLTGDHQRWTKASSKPTSSSPLRSPEPPYSPFAQLTIFITTRSISTWHCSSVTPTKNDELQINPRGRDLSFIKPQQPRDWRFPSPSSWDHWQGSV